MTEGHSMDIQTTHIIYITSCYGMHHLTVSHQHGSGQNVGELMALQDSNEIQNQNEELFNPVRGNADLLSPGLSV